MLALLMAFASITVGLPAVAAPLGQPLKGASSYRAQRTPPTFPEEPKKKKSKHANDFLLIGTVFTEEGGLLEGAELRIRRAGEKKFHWETHTDRRGEFAVRVQQGADYEIIVRARGFQEQSRTVDAKSGDREDLVFRMAPAAEGKSE